jgi:hypothetical protein
MRRENDGAGEALDSNHNRREKKQPVLHDGKVGREAEFESSFSAAARNRRGIA